MRPPFDRVYCVSLPRSTDRRQHAARELTSVGLGEFQFFDATDQDSPLVADYRQRGLVATYPPCFRCGQRVCDCPNNILIDPQVATFITFKRLWVGVALVVEDDIKFTDYAPALIRDALTKDNLAAIGLTADTESLLGLGWARTAEHTWTGKYQFLPKAVKMANSAFVLTNAMARKLMSSFVSINCTADTHIHRKIGSGINNHILLPPISYDLSQSTGAFQSMIRPKQLRVEYLRQTQPHDVEAITDAERKASTQIIKIHPYDVACVGHPRCGSAYMAHLLTAFGLDVGHERLGAHGISSWMFAADDDPYPYARNRGAELRRDKHFATIIHHVRNPDQAIPSIMVENQHSPVSYQFRRRHILKELAIDLDAYTSDLERAVVAYLAWNRLIEKMRPSLVVQVEHCEVQVRQHLVSQGLIPAEFRPLQLPPKTLNSAKPYKGQVIRKPRLEAADWSGLSKNITEELRQFCLKYGYLEVGLQSSSIVPCRH